MTEIGTIMTFECARQPGGTHIIEDNFIEETIEHDGDRPVPYGERAERVVTSFGRGFIPLIRYRTKDLVVKVPHTECGCGRTGDLYLGGIQGRWDDMKLVRGTNVYPRAVESIVRECTAVDEFQILLTREGLHDEITVLIEMKPGRADHWTALQSRLIKDLPDAHEGLRFNVILAEPDSLPRFELKAKRLVDKRPAAIYT
jgi:phenylacetate-CoA ligase